MLFNKLPKDSPLINITIQDFENKSSSPEENNRLISIILYEILIHLLPETSIMNHFIQYICDPSIVIRKKIFSLLLNKNIFPKNIYDLIIVQHNTEILKLINNTDDIITNENEEDDLGLNNKNTEYSIPLQNDDMFNADYLKSNKYLYYVNMYGLTPQTAYNSKCDLNIKNIKNLNEINTDQIGLISSKMVNKCENYILDILFKSNKELLTNTINYYYNKLLSLHNSFLKNELSDDNIESLLFYSHIYTVILNTSPGIITESTKYYLKIIIELIEFSNEYQNQSIIF